MKVKREQLIRRLERVSFALSHKAVVEQADSFVWKDGLVAVYNGETVVRTKGVPGVALVTPAASLLDLLGRFPDDELEVSQSGEGLVFKGARKEAGVFGRTGLNSMLEDIPFPKKWSPLVNGSLEDIVLAAGVCGRDETFGATTCVHISPTVIEASDSYRLFRRVGETGLPGEAYLPATSVDPAQHWSVSGKGWKVAGGNGSFREWGLSEVSISKGWCFFRSKRVVIGIRGRQLERYPDFASVCERKGGIRLKLPKELDLVLHRAIISAEGEGYAMSLAVSLKGSTGLVRAKKETGWYKERFDCHYGGPPIQFTVHPKLLAAVLKMGARLYLLENKIVGISGETTFVISLHAAK